jgi:two-component system, response regulator PdtaR
MNKKVMIIDDDRELLSELEEILGASGYDITALDNSESALSVAMQNHPDVILMDLKMPGKSGFELADEINRMIKPNHIPVIVMSAFFREDFKSLMTLCGIKKYLKKPFPVSDAISAIEEVTLRNK